MSDLSEMSELLGSEPVAIRVVEPEHAPLLANRTPSRAGSRSGMGGHYIVKQENPRQRLALEYASKGKTNSEIAELTGYHPATVGALLRQPSTQQTLVDEIRRTVDKVDEEVLAVIKEGCLVSAQNLLRIAKNEKSAPKDHIAVASAFLNRRYGMPNQPINANTSVDLNHLSDAELAKQLVGETSATGTTA